jgi:DHA2 family multidrug resistance protein
MMLQYAPIGFIFIPAITASYFGVSQDKSDTVSGLTNFSRNIGSSFGASLVTTVLARRQQFHLVRLGESMTPTSPMLSSTLQAMARQAPAGSGPSGQVMGLALIYQWLIGQAAALSFLDVYMVLGSASAMMFFASFLLKSNDPRHTEVKSGH